MSIKIKKAKFIVPFLFLAVSQFAFAGSFEQGQMKNVEKAFLNSAKTVQQAQPHEVQKVQAEQITQFKTELKKAAQSLQIRSNTDAVKVYQAIQDLHDHIEANEGELRSDWGRFSLAVSVRLSTVSENLKKFGIQFEHGIIRAGLAIEDGAIVVGRLAAAGVVGAGELAVAGAVGAGELAVEAGELAVAGVVGAGGLAVAGAVEVAHLASVVAFDAAAIVEADIIATEKFGHWVLAELIKAENATVTDVNWFAHLIAKGAIEVGHGCETFGEKILAEMKIGAIDTEWFFASLAGHLEKGGLAVYDGISTAWNSAETHVKGDITASIRFFKDHAQSSKSVEAQKSFQHATQQSQQTEQVAENFSQQDIQQ